MQFGTLTTTTTPKKKSGARLGKRIEGINRLFRDLPAKHKSAAVYKAMGLAAGIKAESLEKHAAVALALIEGSAHGA